jgi:uracil-DNA glycosylase
MTTTQSTSRNEDRALDRDRELERTIRDALVLAVGKRAADRALRHARTKAHDGRKRRLGYAAGHLAGYGALLAFIWHLRRAPKHSAG